MINIVLSKIYIDSRRRRRWDAALKQHSFTTPLLIPLKKGIASADADAAKLR